MSTQQDIYDAGSENRPPMLNKENYVPWSSHLLRYVKSRPNGKLIYNSIINDDELTKKELKQVEANDQAIQTILIGLPKNIYAAVDSCKTAQEIWLRVQQMMKGFDIRIQEKKARLFNEWERFTSTEEESIESYYHHFSKLMNDFKRNKHFLEKIASNIKFRNNLQPEWSRHVTIIHKTKDLHTANYTQLYDFLKYNQKEVDDLRVERLAKIHDPLALMANSNNPFNYPLFHQDQPSSNRHMQMVGGNGGNQSRQYVGQNVRNQNGYNAVQNVRNHVVQNAVQSGRLECWKSEWAYCCSGGLLYQNAEWANEDWVILLGIAQSDQGEGMLLIFRLTDLDEIEEVNANCILIANLQQASTSDEQYTELLEAIPEPHQVQQNDSNVISEVSSVEQDGGTVDQHPATVEETRAYFESLYNNLAIEFEKVNMVNRKLRETNADLTTKLINALHLSSGKQITTLNEEISHLNNQLSKEKSTVSSLLEEKKKLKSNFKIHEDELLDKQIQLENKIKELDNILVKMGQSIKTHAHCFHLSQIVCDHTKQKMALGYQNLFDLKKAQQEQQSLYNGKVLFEMHDPPAVYDSEDTLQLSAHVTGEDVIYFQVLFKTANVSKPISIPNEEFSDDTTPSVARKFLNEIHKIIKDEIFPIVNQVDARLQNFEIQFLKEAAKFVRDFKSLAKEADESLAKHKAWNWIISPSGLLRRRKKLENENVELEFQALNYAKENAHLKTTYKNLFDSIYVTRTQAKTIIDSLQNKLHDTIYENAKLRSQLFDMVSEQKDITKGTSVNTKFANQSTKRKPSLQPLRNKFVVRQPNAFQSERPKLSNPGFFKRINPSKTFRKDKFVPINKVRASVRTNPITVSQSHVITKKDVNSDSNGFYSTGVNITVIQICLWYVDSGCSKHMTGNLKLFINFVWKFLGTIRFGNDHIAAILSFSDLQWGNILITRVYFVEGLGYNLFSVGQFCDSDLEVAFKRNTCFVRNLEGVDLLKGNRTRNLYTINLHDMASTSPICFMAHATSTKSWLWHQRLSHLNFDTINNLARNNLVTVFQNLNIIKNIFIPHVSKEKVKGHITHPNQF
ncbi:retrovirus-related pol polyprotein from transposon TNT 1-94 [Tanacetum coccineum]